MAISTAASCGPAARAGDDMHMHAIAFEALRGRADELAVRTSTSCTCSQPTVSGDGQCWNRLRWLGGPCNSR